MNTQSLLAIADESLILARCWIDSVFLHKTPPNEVVSEMINQQLNHALAMLDYWITFFSDEIEMEFVLQRKANLMEILDGWQSLQPGVNPITRHHKIQFTQEQLDEIREQIENLPEYKIEIS